MQLDESFGMRPFRRGTILLEERLTSDGTGVLTGDWPCPSDFSSLLLESVCLSIEVDKEGRDASVVRANKVGGGAEVASFRPAPSGVSSMATSCC